MKEGGQNMEIRDKNHTSKKCKKKEEKSGIIFPTHSKVQSNS